MHHAQLAEADPSARRAASAEVPSLVEPAAHAGRGHLPAHAPDRGHRTNGARTGADLPEQMQHTCTKLKGMGHFFARLIQLKLDLPTRASSNKQFIFADITIIER